MPVTGLHDIRNQLPTANTQYMTYRDLGAIDLIIVHYDAENRPATYDALTRYKAQANYHINKDWSARPGVTRKIPGFRLMYHLKIAGDGKKYLCNDFNLITWQARAGNPTGLGICLDCGPTQEPTPAQLKALHEVLEDCIWKCPEFPAAREDVYGHSEVKTNATACPGKILPYVKKFRRKEW